jgi:CRP/FNR family cyclic AMP-dependent transcriptional regulator
VKTDEKLSILGKVPFFKGLSRSELTRIGKSFTEKEFRRGQYLFWEGDPASWLYVIKQGRVKVIKPTPSGKEIILEVIAPGDICGGGSIFARTHPASAKAVEKTKAYSISSQSLLALLAKHQNLSREIIRYLGEKLMKTHEMIIALVSSSVDKRIMALLLGLSEKHGTPIPEGVRINIRLTRQEIADIVGARVETAIRVMSRLTKQGLITSDSKGIVLTDREKLRKLAAKDC